MKVNKQELLAHCISEGLLDTIYSVDDVSHQKLEEIVDKATHRIWSQIDTYFSFDDN
jgi:hypothetical protein